MQHLDPHSQALFRDQPDGHGKHVEFLTREMQMASLVCVKALSVTFMCGAFEPTNILSHRSSCHVDVKPHVTRLEIMVKCSHKNCCTMFHSMLRVDDPTTSQHRANLQR